MGTYGDCVVPFRGYSVVVPVGVGEQDSAEHEAEIFQSKQEDARRHVRDREDRYARLYARFARGTAKRRRFLGRLDTDRAESQEGDYKARFALPDESAQIRLHLKPGTPDAIVEKVLADFILSDGVKACMAEAGPEHFARERDKAFDGCFDGWGWHEMSLGLPRDARFALTHAAWLRETAKAPDSERTWKARALLCAIGEEKVGDRLWRPIAGVVDSDRWLRYHGMMLRLANDDEWDDARARVAQAFQGRGGWDETSRGWLQSLLGAEQ